MSYELALSSKLGGSFVATITSFSRYVSLNTRVEKYLGKTAATLVVRRIIDENSARLSRLKRGSANLAVNVYNLISQLKSAKVTVDEIKRIVALESGAFKSKLEDIAVVYEEYEKFVSDNGFTDENSYLSLMPELLRRDERIRGAKVVVSGVTNLTGKTVDILETLEKLSDLSVVTVSADAPGYVNEIYYKVLDLFKTCEVFDDGELDDVHEAILRGLFDPAVFKKVGLYSDKVHIFEFSDATAEATAVAKRIRYEVVKNGRRYKDFVVACASVANYAPLYERVFKEYDIPLYADVKRGLRFHPLVKFTNDIIDLRRLNYKPETALKVVKNRLAFSEEESAAFENYFAENTPSRRMMTREFSAPNAEKVRSKIISAANSLPLKNSVGGYIDGLLKIFDEFGVYENSEKLSLLLSENGEEELARFNQLATKSFLSLLNETALVSGDGIVDISLFKSLVASAVGATEISLIATHYDNVFMGDMTSAAQAEAEILFVVGADSSLPDVKKDVALLCDRELIRMDGYKCVIEPKLKVVNVRARENVLTTLLSFKEELFVSRSRLDAGGNKVADSVVIDYLERIFATKSVNPTELERSRAVSYGQYDYLAPRPALVSAINSCEKFSSSAIDDLKFVSAYLAIAENKDKSAYNFVIDNISKNKTPRPLDISYKGKISATLIETYFSCPYKAFGDRILRLKEKSTGDVKPYETGNIFHNVFQEFAPLAADIPESRVESVALKIAENVFKKDEYARYLNKKQYEAIFSLVKKEVVKACFIVYRDISASDFKVWGTEMSFSNVPGSDFKAVTIDTNDGPKQVNGFIDRVDKFGDYVRIIDYKTGDVSGKDSALNLYTGNSIQLYLYMNAVASRGLKLAAAHYLSVSDAYCKEGAVPLNYTGKTLADNEIISHLDTSETGGNSKKLSIKHKRDGNFDSNSKVLNEFEMSAYTKYARRVTESGANEIYGGLFLPSPYTEKACEYCRLKGMCGYDCETGKFTRKVDSVDTQTVINALSNGENDEQIYR